MKVRKRRHDSIEILRFGEEYIGRFLNEMTLIRAKLSISRIFDDFYIKSEELFLAFHFEIYHCTLRISIGIAHSRYLFKISFKISTELGISSLRALRSIVVATSIYLERVPET